MTKKKQMTKKKFKRGTATYLIGQEKNVNPYKSRVKKETSAIRILTPSEDVYCLPCRNLCQVCPDVDGPESGREGRI
jgi:hypothetical protein